MSTKSFLITSVLFSFLLSVAAGQCFANASAQTVKAFPAPITARHMVIQLMWLACRARQLTSMVMVTM
jgi:hypothetical protein